MVLIVLCFGVEFLYCLRLMYVFIIFSSVQVSEWLPIGGIAAHSAYDMSSWYNYLSVILVFFLTPQFVELEFLSDCAIS